MKHLALAAALLAVAACGRGESGNGLRLQGEAQAAQRTPLFTRLASQQTGLRFENRLVEAADFNVFTFRNFYNGGGVAIGDLTGDGLPEVLLTSSQHGIRLFLNLGQFRFRDITDAAHVASAGYWTTGVTFADVDGDGRLDIYVCHSGNGPGRARANELFINQGVDSAGVPAFVEMAGRYGIQDHGYSTHAAFFDADGDGRLDLYVLNNSPRAVTSFGLRNRRTERDSLGGDRLYRNLGTRFADVSARAGIFGNEAAFGLGVVVGDVNNDGHPDIYISNDFFEQDYLYINRGNGTFIESIAKAMPYTSYYSMGLDVADVNNDGWLDVYTTDMLPEGEQRLKSTSAFEGWDVYQAKVKNGYHHQLMRNMLQLNNGDGTFSDVGQLAGVARTDWSWSALIADFDLDGNKDIYVTNGILRDVTSQDYIALLSTEATRRRAIAGNRVDFMQLISAASSTKLTNYAFRNTGQLGFTNETAGWGLDTPAFSNGAAYGDLDGDGAVDLVINNVNDEAFVYRNNARALTKPNHYLQVALDGTGSNRFAVGARVTIVAGGARQVQELSPARGFESSVDYVLTFGLGSRAAVDSVAVRWPDGRVSTRTAVAANQRLRLSQGEARREPAVVVERGGPLLAPVVAPRFTHRENPFVDFDRERLMPRMVSTEGPTMAVADVDGDGLDDVFVGGAVGRPGRLFIQRRDGTFANASDAAFAVDAASEDVGSLFFDADGDGRPDLLVVSGGNEYGEGSAALQDRLYLNDGAGRFHKASGALPADHSSGSRAVAADFDGDGDLDVFIGGRVLPGHYGRDPASQLLRNDGKGRFTNVVAQVAPALERAGMVTDAAWADVTGDGRVDLVVVGDWMPVLVFRNTGDGRLEPLRVPGLENSGGWWNRIVAGDFTGDGRVDFVVGNLGLNSRLRATAAEPASLYVKDFAHTGFDAQIVACYNEGRNFPIAMRDDLLKSLPYLQQRFPTYRDYAQATVSDVFSFQDLNGSVVKHATTFATALLRNDGGGSFTMVPLPLAAQLAPVYGILADDVDGDGVTDLLLGGNLDEVKPEIGRLHASYGLYLRGSGKGNFSPVPATESGFFVPGATRDIRRVRTARGDIYLVARNNDSLLAFRPTRPAPSVALRGTAAP